jgi:hypothetical protein
VGNTVDLRESSVENFVREVGEGARRLQTFERKIIIAINPTLTYLTDYLTKDGARKKKQIQPQMSRKLLIIRPPNNYIVANHISNSASNVKETPDNKATK